MISMSDILTATAREALATYDQRDGLTRKNSLDGSWDLKQAARLAEQVRSLLTLVDDMKAGLAK